MGLFDRLISKKSTAPIHQLKVDIHSHLLPGIDDGSPDMDHTIGMLRKFKSFGFEKLILTPHVMTGVYDNTPEIILDKLDEVRQIEQELGLGLTLEASSEYYFDEQLMGRISNKEILPFAGNHLLFELSFRNEPQQLNDLIFHIRAHDLIPVIAHFERYFYYHKSLKVANELKERGCLIQVNLNSFTGHYGPEVKKQALALLKAGLIDVAGSDCHRIQHLEMVENHLTDRAFHQLIASDLLNKRI
jgi:tyrosine-protein phosphatase YwqE